MFNRQRKERFTVEAIRLATIADNFCVFDNTKNPKGKHDDIDKFVSRLIKHGMKKGSWELEMTFPESNVGFTFHRIHDVMFYVTVTRPFHENPFSDYLSLYHAMNDTSEEEAYV